MMGRRDDEREPTDANGWHFSPPAGRTIREPHRGQLLGRAAGQNPETALEADAGE